MDKYLFKTTIPFYVSSHGFGHMTRVLAIVIEILKYSSYDIYIVSGKKQIDFAKIYLKKYEQRLTYKILLTDVGLITKKNMLAVDNKALQKELAKFVSNWKKIVDSEYAFLRTKNIQFIVTDISPIGPLVADTLKCPSYAISNFTWKDQYERLDISNEILENFSEAYNNITHYIRYELTFGNAINGCEVSNVGFISREINYEFVKYIKRKFNPEIFLTLGKSAIMSNVQIRNTNNTIFVTEGVEVSASNKIIKLPLSTIDTHNYIAACEYIIAKAGWSTVAEALIGGTKLILLDRPSVYEDTFIIDKLKEEKLAISIKEEQLKNLDFETIKNFADISIDTKKLYSIKNDICKIIRLLNLTIK